MAVLTETREGQVWVGTDVPLLREEASCFLWVVQHSKVVGCCPGVQALSVRGCFVVTPVDMLAVEVANIQAGVWERRDGRWCESRVWRFVDVNDLISGDVYAQPLSLWLFWRQIDQWPFQPLMDNVAKPRFPLRTDPATEKLGITSLSAVVQWVSCRTIMKSLFLSASCSMTKILSAVSPSVFSCSGHLRQHSCCRALRMAFQDPPHVEHIQCGKQWLLSYWQV